MYRLHHDLGSTSPIEALYKGSERSCKLSYATRPIILPQHCRVYHNTFTMIETYGYTALLRDDMLGKIISR